MYTNSKNQITLEEAYKRVYVTESHCCEPCSKGEECNCEDHTEEVPQNVDDALETSKEIVYDGDDAKSELKEFLPLIFAGAASSLGADELKAQHIADNLMSRVDISEVESRISDIHAEKERLTKEAQYSMEAQIKLNKVIDDLLKQGALEALDVLYSNPQNGVPPSGVVKSLEKEIQKRISSRK